MTGSCSGERQRSPSLDAVGSEVVLEESHWFWPIVLFPYAIENAHTRSFTGRTTLAGIKSSLARAIVTLSEDHLRVRGRVTRHTHLLLPLTGIESASTVPGKPGVVEIKFAGGTWGRLARAVTSGEPAGSRNRILLNVLDADLWVAELSSRIPSEG